MTRRNGIEDRTDRGNSYQRRQRKAWVLATFGDGVTVECSVRRPDSRRPCRGTLSASTLFVIRYDTDKGFVRGNLRPACDSCTYKQADLVGNARKARARRDRGDGRSNVESSGAMPDAAE